MKYRYTPVGWDNSTNDRPPALNGQNLKQVEDGLLDIVDELTDIDYQIGDTLTTYRNNLSANWLYCNGDGFSAEDYPELAELPLIMPQKFGVWQVLANTQILETDGANVIVTGIKHNQDKTLTLEYKLSDINSASITVTVAENVPLLASYPNGMPYYNPAIKYINGYWVIKPTNANYIATTGYKLYFSDNINGPYQSTALPGFGTVNGDIFYYSAIYSNGTQYAMFVTPFWSNDDKYAKFVYANNIEGPYVVNNNLNIYVNDNPSPTLNSIDNTLFYTTQAHGIYTIPDASGSASFTSWPNLVSAPSGIQKQGNKYFFSTSDGTGYYYTHYASNIFPLTNVELLSFPARPSYPYTSGTPIPVYHEGVWFVTDANGLLYSSESAFDPASFTHFIPQLPGAVETPSKFTSKYIFSTSGGLPNGIVYADKNMHSLPVALTGEPTYIKGSDDA